MNISKSLKVVIATAAIIFSTVVATAAPVKVITVAQDGSGDYKTVAEALRKVRGDMDDTVKVFIKNGVYREKIVMNVTSQNVIVQGENPFKTIITWDDFASRNNMGTSGSYTFKVEGNNITFMDLTFENAAGPDAGQAVAVFTTGDCLKFINCRFLGNQDTLYTGGRSARLYFENCYIEGTTDFIFGAATALFSGCEIHCKADSYITAASTSATTPVGYVFHGCHVTAAPGVKAVYLGRPWRPNASTFFIKCLLPEAIRPEGWHNWNNTANEATARYGEFACYGPGASTDARVNWRRTLDADAAAAMVNPDSLFERCSTWHPY